MLARRTGATAHHGAGGLHTESALGQRPRQPTRPRRLEAIHNFVQSFPFYGTIFLAPSVPARRDVSSFWQTQHTQGTLQQQKMTEPAEKTSILVPTEVLGDV